MASFIMSYLDFLITMEAGPVLSKETELKETNRLLPAKALDSTVKNESASQDPGEKKPLQCSALFLIWKDVLVLSANYFCVCLCYFSIIYNLDTFFEGNIAFTTLATVFAAEVVSSFLVPTKWIIQKLGCKKVLIFSSLGSVIFTAVQFYPNVTYFTLLPAGFFLGATYVWTWVSLCTYTSFVTAQYVELTTSNRTVVFSSFLGITSFFGVLGGIVGNAVSFGLLSSKVDEDDLLKLQDADLEICGSNYCQQSLYKFSHLHSNVTTRPEHSNEIYQGKQLLLFFYLGISLLGPLFSGTLLSARKHVSVNSEKENESSVKDFIAMYSALLDTRFLLLGISCINLGLIISYASGPFSRAFIMCTYGAHYVSLLATMHMAAYSLSALVIGVLIRVCDIIGVLVTTSVLCEIVFIFMLQWIPNDEDITLPSVFTSIMGACIGMYATILNTSLNRITGDSHAAGFAFYRGFYAIGSTLGFAWANHVCVSVMLYTLCVLNFVGTVFYFIAEYKFKKNND